MKKIFFRIFPLVHRSFICLFLPILLILLIGIFPVSSGRKVIFY